jgi:hypothetical protein
MPKLFGVVVAVFALAAGVAAQHESKNNAPTVTGVWNMAVEGDHVIPIGMELAQDGRSVTGKILLPTSRGGRREVALSGEFADGELTLAAIDEDANGDGPALKLRAKLADDGTLSGTLSSRHGEMKWSAERLNPRHH